VQEFQILPEDQWKVDDHILVPIERINYVWAARIGRSHPMVVGWYLEFEQLLAQQTYSVGEFKAQVTKNNEKHRRHLWQRLREVLLDMHEEMKKNKGTTIIEGMREPFELFTTPEADFWVPRKGNQRLCILRGHGHTGRVPAIIINAA